MHSQHYLQDDSTESLQTSVWWPTSTSASLSLSCCTSPKKPPFVLSLRTSQTDHSKWWLSWVSFLLHATWILKNQAQQVTTCLCCFCFQGVDLLLLLFCCRIWGRTLRLSTGRTFKPLKSNVAAMTTVTSWKAGSQFQNKESARKRLDFSDFVFQLLYLIKGGTKMNQRQYYYRLFCFSIAARRFHAISCYFIKEPPTSTEDWLFRFSSSCRCCSAAVVAEAYCASRRKEALRNLEISWAVRHPIDMN